MEAMRRYLTACALSALTALPAWAEQLPLSEISKYLNGLQTAKAPFTQINDDGSLSTGMLYIKRPGRMRFEYDPPNEAVVVAGAGAVVIFDPKSNTEPDSVPLDRTPLSIILERNVDLGRRNMVTGHGFDGTATIVTAQDPEKPEYGNIQLSFTADPVELRKWVITDGNGGQTTVILQGMETRGRLSAGLFDVTAIGERPGLAADDLEETAQAVRDFAGACGAAISQWRDRPLAFRSQAAQAALIPCSPSASCTRPTRSATSNGL